MRNITKQPEPKSLTEHRCKEHANYDNYDDMDGLRKSLVSEQGNVCCYCMQRIKDSEDEMKVEHWRSQKRYPKFQLDYNNLLGACRGGHGSPQREQHCDTRKGNKDLKYSPANPQHDIESKIRYLGSGRIVSDDRDFDAQLNDVLNLNLGKLVKNRKGVLDAFKASLGKRPARTRDWNVEHRKWSEPSSKGLKPFCQVVLYYINKKLA